MHTIPIPMNVSINMLNFFLHFWWTKRSRCNSPELIRDGKKVAFKGSNSSSLKRNLALSFLFIYFELTVVVQITVCST